MSRRGGRGRRQRQQQQMVRNLPLAEATIESLTLEGKGVTHIDGKAVFVDGGLPNEKVSFRYVKQSRNYDEGVVVEVLEASPERIEGDCQHYPVCGGCSWQHISPEKQIEYKQKAMLDQLKHVGKVEPEAVFEPMLGDIWAYRRKARLGVRYVHKKERVLVGFRERAGTFLADMTRCEVLHESVGKDLTTLQDLVGSLSIRDRIPQIEMIVGDNATALTVRHLAPLTEEDIAKVYAYGEAHGCLMFLQPKGPDTVHRIYPAPEQAAELFYEHPAFQTRIDFGPQDFVQVNQTINRAMVQRAIELLEPQADDVVLDLFCGLGNFTLPLAKQVKQVVGVEGDELMVKRAKESALNNGVENTSYYACNLMGDMAHVPWLNQSYDKILLDPPRAGAKEVIEHFGELGAKRIVYVSCNPATLARDAGELVHTHGYRLLGAGVMDMFPHTSHIESIAVFEKA